MWLSAAGGEKKQHQPPPSLWEPRSKGEQQQQQQPPALLWEQHRSRVAPKPPAPDLGGRSLWEKDKLPLSTAPSTSPWGSWSAVEHHLEDGQRQQKSLWDKDTRPPVAQPHAPSSTWQSDAWSQGYQRQGWGQQRLWDQGHRVADQRYPDPWRETWQ
eukprot:TRINITY_DN5528_c0_g1_i3.p2 TRINITY_DN5528_c0_g1~~TRINITY_DN5528_c0_g1_i3.p2  ORF type:complete len:157 (+),score=30.04 TRINITY_DN5528_c0_g1_i3:304-774(+)